jgi:hypothetical protein
MANKFTCARAVLDQLATLPAPRDDARLRFYRLMLRVYREARLYADMDRYLFDVSAKDIVKQLKPVERAALDLETTLARLQCPPLSTREPKLAAAGLAAHMLAEALIGSTDMDDIARDDPLTNLRILAAKLIAAITEAETRTHELTRTPWRPRSVGRNQAFVTLVWRLDRIAEMTGGAWTLRRDRIDGNYEGTFLEALNVLRPYLPTMVWPKAKLFGRVVEHMRKRRPRTA